MSIFETVLDLQTATPTYHGTISINILSVFQIMTYLMVRLWIALRNEFGGHRVKKLIK